MELSIYVNKKISNQKKTVDIISDSDYMYRCVFLFLEYHLSVYSKHQNEMQ